MKNSSKYLNELKSSQYMSSKAAKVAHVQGIVNPKRGLRYKTLVPLFATIQGATGAAGAGPLGLPIGLALGVGMGLEVNRAADRHGIDVAKKKIENALDAGMITEKELKNYVNTGKVTPGIISALNTK